MAVVVGHIRLEGEMVASVVLLLELNHNLYSCKTLLLFSSVITTKTCVSNPFRSLLTSTLDRLTREIKVDRQVSRTQQPVELYEALTDRATGRWTGKLKTTFS